MRQMQCILLFGFICTLLLVQGRTAVDQSNEEMKNTTKEVVDEATTATPPNCPQDADAFEYDGKCFWIIANYSAVEQQSYYVTRTWCQATGGDVGNVYSEEHYGMVGKLAMLKLEGLSLYFWTNMTYEFEIQKTFLGNFEEAAYVDWGWGYPSKYIDHSGVKIQIGLDPSPFHRGYYNRNRSDGSKGVLCEAVKMQ